VNEMDLTVVNQIAATNTWIIAAIGALGAIFGALAGGFATYCIEKLKIKNMDAQRMQQAYSELMGHKYMILQIYDSYFNSFIGSELLNRCSYITAISEVDYSHITEITKNDINKRERAINQNINDIIKDSTEYKFAMEADNRCRELELKLGESYERLWTTIGLIQVVFSDTSKLEKLIKLIDIPTDENAKGKIFDNFSATISDIDLEFKRELLKKAVKSPHGTKIESEQMQNDALKLHDERHLELKSKIKDFESRIDDLLKYLKAEIVAIK